MKKAFILCSLALAMTWATKRSIASSVGDTIPLSFIVTNDALTAITFDIPFGSGEAWIFEMATNFPPVWYHVGSETAGLKPPYIRYAETTPDLLAFGTNLLVHVKRIR